MLVQLQTSVFHIFIFNFLLENRRWEKCAGIWYLLISTPPQPPPYWPISSFIPCFVSFLSNLMIVIPALECLICKNAFVFVFCEIPWSFFGHFFLRKRTTCADEICICTRKKVIWRNLYVLSIGYLKGGLD